jgi:hypothetical protein
VFHHIVIPTTTVYTMRYSKTLSASLRVWRKGNRLRYVFLLIVTPMTVNQGKHLRYVFLHIVILIHLQVIITVTITIATTITTTAITTTTTTTITITITTITTTRKQRTSSKKISHHLVSHLIVIHPLLSQTTNHLQFVFHLIASPIPRTNSKRRNSRIIPESALKWAVRPISSPVGLPRNAFLQPVILPTTMGTSTTPTHKWISWMNHHQYVSHLIVIRPTFPGTNTNLSLWERTKIDHLQFASHHIVIPIPRVMKMMKVISRKTQYLPSKQTRRGSKNISAHIPKLSLYKNTVPIRTRM